MRAMPEGYERNGRPCCFQLDFDAFELLQELAPGPKTFGRFISELIRRDAIRRREWAEARAVQHAALVEVGQCHE